MKITSPSAGDNMINAAVLLPATKGTHAGLTYFSAQLRPAQVRQVAAYLEKPAAGPVGQNMDGGPDDSFGSLSGMPPVTVLCVDGVLEFNPLGDDPVGRLAGRLAVFDRSHVVMIHANGRATRISLIGISDRDTASSGDETTLTIIIPDPGLKRCADLLRQVKRSRSAAQAVGLMSAVHDRRFRAARLAERVVEMVSYFAGLTETTKSTISNRSTKLFTLTGIRNATEVLLAGLAIESDEDSTRLAIDFWTEIGNHIPEWRIVKEGKVSSAELRRTFVHAHTLALAAIARAGNQLLKEDRETWRSRLKRLETLDWRRSNTRLWEGRAMNAGRISKHSVNVTLTANVVKRRLGLALSAQEKRIEREFLQSRKR